jgi:hypothetical protein
MGKIIWEQVISARDSTNVRRWIYCFRETNSTDGGVIAGYGSTKDMALKITPTGALQWQKGTSSGLDIGNHLEITTDGGYLIAASSSSNDGITAIMVRGIHG